VPSPTAPNLTSTPPPAADSLPVTGAAATGIGIAGAALLGLGAAILFFLRRRTRPAR
jgi:LPXTG-motif cell wall-anchored protein